MDLNKIKEMILPNGKKITKLEYLSKAIWQSTKKNSTYKYVYNDTTYTVDSVPDVFNDYAYHYCLVHKSSNMLLIYLTNDSRSGVSDGIIYIMAPKYCLTFNGETWSVNAQTSSKKQISASQYEVVTLTEG